MPDRLTVSNFKTGLENDRLAFIINNDAFPYLQNFYIWRGRLKKKRGLLFLGRLEREILDQDEGTITTPWTTFSGTITIPAGGTVDFSSLEAFVDATITGVTAGATTTITATNNFANGQQVYISGVVGISPNINGGPFTISSRSGSSFVVNVATSGSYTSGGVASVYGQIYRTITGISNASSAVVTSNGHNIPNGSTVLITGVNGLNLQATITGATQASQCVLTCVNSFQAGDSIMISGVVGMTQLNGNEYQIVFQTPNSITINIDSTLFSSYTSGGNIIDISSSVVNNLTFTTSAATTNTFDINANTSAASAYTGNGVASTFSNPSTGAFTVQFNPAFSSNGTILADFSYFPNIPVMGLKTFIPFSPALTFSSIPQNQLVAFDTTYSYQVNQNDINSPFYDVSFYKNSGNPVVWTGEDYQQFWTWNYQGALWTTNGVPGFQYQKITSISYVDSTDLTLTITSSPAIVGDYVWINEISATNTPSNYKTINGQTGKVTAIGAGTITVNFPNANIANDSYTGGIIQYLTVSVPGQGDGIRWYDGDPTGDASTTGWVNFSPPLSQFNPISGNTSIQYLVGATAVVAFKDRLLFLGAYVSTSAPVQEFLQDTVIYSQNGTAYYTASWDGTVATPTYTPILVPTDQTATPSAWYTSPAGFGGFVSAGIDQPIVSVNNNEDVLLVGFPGRQTRLVYTSNDYIPFLFYSINSEIGSGSTFAGVTLDQGGLTFGQYGLALTTQTSTARIDLVIPDQVFEIQSINNGRQRVCAIRDYRNEWIYFTYPSGSSPYVYPTQSLLYNYRDNTWATFDENFTTYGTFKFLKDFTWSNNPYTTWGATHESWTSGVKLAGYPNVIGGNQQGFVMIKGNDDTSEEPSGYISNVVITGSFPQQIITITSTNHCLNSTYDYVYIQGVLGVTGINNTIRQVLNTTTNTFTVNLNVAGVPLIPTGTYLGGGTFSRFSVPYMQTKQFPVYWEQGKKTRIGTQRYLFDVTDLGQVTAEIFLSQNADQAANGPPFYPSANVYNSSLIFTQELFTCPETNNLNQQSVLQPSGVTVSGQDQMWHRVSSSLIGDTVQLGLTLSDAQMTDPTLQTQTSDIVLHSFSFDVYPSQVLI